MLINSTDSSFFSSTNEVDPEDSIFDEPQFDVDDISSFVHDHGLSPVVLEYENAINVCGYGWFQRILLIVCGWAFVSDSIEIQVVSFVLPAACDLAMTSSEKGWLNAIIFVGMMFGGYTFGGTADIKGRRYILRCSLAINGVFGFLSAFAPEFTWFLLFRFLSGIGVGAALPVLFSYYAEFLSKEIRGPMVEALASFLLLGNIMAAAGAWIIIPSGTFVVGGYDIRSWRLFVALFSIPALSAAACFLFMPESPKFLIYSGQPEEAKKIFKKIFMMNNRKHVVVPRVITDMTFYDQMDGSLKLNGIFKVMKATRNLFEKDLRRATFPLVTIWSTMSFAYYGLWMWLPEIYNRMNQSNGFICSNNYITTTYRYTTNSSNLLKNHTDSNITFSNNPCNIGQHYQNNEVYLKTFIIAFSNIPGAIVAITTIDKFGRRNLLASSMLMGGISVLFFLLVVSEVEMIVMSCLFSGLTVVSWNVLNIVALENYPTPLRSTAFGLQTSVGRIASILGNVVFGFLVDIQCSVPLVLVTISFIIGGISVFLVPNTDHIMLT